MNSFNFADLPLPAFRMIVNFVTPAELYYTALKVNESVLDRLRSVAGLPEALLDVVMKPQEKKIGFRFEDQTLNFKIEFEIIPRTGRMIPEPATTEMLEVLGKAQRYHIGSVSEMTVDLCLMNRPMLTRLMDTPCEKMTVIGQPSIMGHGIVAEAVNKAKPSLEFCIESDIGGIFPTSHPAHKLSLQFSHETTRTNLLNLAGKTKEIELLRTSLTSEDVHQFMKAWFESTEKTTVTLTVSRKDEKTWSLEKVFGDIPHSAYQDDRRQKSFVTSRSETGIPETVVDMSQAHDMIRTDGTISSVLISAEMLFFCCWHNPFEIRQKREEYEGRKREAEQRAQHLFERSLELAFRLHEITVELQESLQAVDAAGDQDERARLMVRIERELTNHAQVMTAHENERAGALQRVGELQRVIDRLNGLL